MTTLNLSTLFNPGAPLGLTYTPIQTANFSASVNTVVRLNSTSSGFTVTLPTTPTDGSVVVLFDIANQCGVNAVLAAPSGGATVEGDSSGLSINVTGAYVQLVYNSPTTNWKIADTYANTYNLVTTTTTSISPFLLMGA